MLNAQMNRKTKAKDVTNLGDKTWCKGSRYHQPHDIDNFIKRLVSVILRDISCGSPGADKELQCVKSTRFQLFLIWLSVEVNLIDDTCILKSKDCTKP